MCDNVFDFDTGDIQDTAEFSRDIEFLDTSGIENSIIEELDADAIPETDELGDGKYHATKMSEEEVRRIDEMLDETGDDCSDIEPYRATRNSDMEQTEEVKEPYRATHRSNSSDLSDELTDSSDVARVEMPSSLEEQFADEIESMSFDVISAEHARLDSLGQMDDIDIFAEYDVAQNPKYDPELFDALTDGLPRESLEYLKDGLVTGNPNVYGYFGLNEGENEGGDTPLKLSRKR